MPARRPSTPSAPPTPKRAYVYVDGFNLYHRRLKKGPYRWLDLLRLCEVLLPADCHVEKIKYFTATVSALPWDADAPLRQELYLRALRTLPCLEIHRGNFVANERWMPLINPPAGGPDRALVLRIDEKGSDVKLATHMLIDGFRNRYDIAWVITRDSDLDAPIRAVRHDLQKQVGVLIPSAKGGRNIFEADYYVNIRDNALLQAQFPEKIGTGKHAIRKPDSWKIRPGSMP